ncbi:MAG: hypothetical protein JJE55_11880 [Flavobacteriaceae bacterium]|nr:hypothetical protein [Flavobacteriaceae bacterium]
MSGNPAKPDNIPKMCMLVDVTTMLMGKWQAEQTLITHGSTLQLDGL